MKNTRTFRLLAGATIAGLAMAGASVHAQQSFGQADQTGGGLGGFGQMPMPQGQFGGPPQGQFGGPPQGQYGGPPQGQFGGPPQGQFGGPSQGQFGGPPQGQYGGPPQGQPGMNGQAGGPNPQLMQMLDQMAQFERRDLGVPATDQLHSGAMHGPTPASIPGGQVVTTKGLFELIQGRQTPYLLFDVLGGNETLPGAIPAVQASSPGSFDDGISKQLGQFLEQATRGNRQVPLVFYCASVECWMSYNASLRAIRLGYSNVLWYRGGIAAWKQVGGPTMPPGGGFNPQAR